MSKIKPVFRKRFTLNLANQVKLGNIPEMILYDRLRDGRIIGLLVEDIIAYEFGDMTRTQNNGSSCDLIYTGARTPIRYQCKSFKGNGVSLAPSYMKGASRQFDEEKFFQYFLEIDAWLLVDVGSFPVLTIYCLGQSDILESMNFSKSDVKLSVSDLKRLTKSK